MNCKRFKDWILTDYIDGELGAQERKLIDEHVASCSHCHAFVQEVKANTVLPFNQAIREELPAELWPTIKERLEQAQEKHSPIQDFIRGLMGSFLFPRLAPAFATLILIVLAGTITFNTIQVKQAKDKEQGEYLATVLSADGSSDNDNGALGTSIEDYFL